LAGNTTIGLEFSEKTVSANGKEIILQIWDTAGQERYRALNKTFYKNSMGAIVVFDLSDRKSF
jgi:small GTP-binding protein